jgi:hypothetical protein
MARPFTGLATAGTACDQIVTEFVGRIPREHGSSPQIEPSETASRPSQTSSTCCRRSSTNSQAHCKWSGNGRVEVFRLLLLPPVGDPRQCRPSRSRFCGVGRDGPPLGIRPGACHAELDRLYDPSRTHPSRLRRPSPLAAPPRTSRRRGASSSSPSQVRAICDCVCGHARNGSRLAKSSKVRGSF